MEFKVTIDQFEGPLDLMLHLIKENKLDLFDLDMNVLASQYIDYIQKMEEIHLEIASEYLEELASLVEYKSRKLLPRNDVEVTQDYEEDQRDKLVNRLLEYQRYKEASEFLKEEFDKRQKLYTRPQASIVSSWQSQPVLDSLEKQSPYDLLKAMNRVVSRMAILKPYQTKVTIKELSVEQRVEQVKQILEKQTDKISFEQLCLDCSNLHMVIVTFLSLLDLIHQRIITFTVDEKETIWVYKGDAI
ncbi:MAG: segregation/condensation protein A [Floccifex porci]|uniref:segregation and condensation protein A n=1 Tax=Floccifex porci TaxID=2606629 RepID=UPI0023F4EEE4|nr:segregation/condensation protein A [Floccifex porci]MDD7467063.1 segregation/condensation protein A [Floccifex porci]MDO4480933.1 segregation/condensation protein A [Erysipelotrichaceae bacterium]MDY4797090.1 segregation/condensation protein A [Floccifex porci]